MSKTLRPPTWYGHQDNFLVRPLLGGIVTAHHTTRGYSRALVGVWDPSVCSVSRLAYSYHGSDLYPKTTPSGNLSPTFGEVMIGCRRLFFLRRELPQARSSVLDCYWVSRILVECLRSDCTIILLMFKSSADITEDLKSDNWWGKSDRRAPHRFDAVQS